MTAYEGRPTQTQLDREARAKEELDGAAEDFESLRGEVGGLSAKLEKKGGEPLEVTSREAWELAREGG